MYSKIHQRRKHPECTLAAVGNHDSRDAASVIQQVVDMDNSMHLSLEMSWNVMLGGFAVFQNYYILGKGLAGEDRD